MGKPRRLGTGLGQSQPVAAGVEKSVVRYTDQFAELQDMVSHRPTGGIDLVHNWTDSPVLMGKKILTALDLHLHIQAGQDY